MRRFGVLLGLALIGATVITCAGAANPRRAAGFTEAAAYAGAPRPAQNPHPHPLPLRGRGSRNERRASAASGGLSKRARLSDFGAPGRRAVWWCWGGCR